MKHTRINIKFCVKQFKALADENRLNILRFLLKNPSNVGAIAKELNLEQSLLSHHLAQLRMAGLVVAERNGKQKIYRPADEVTGSTHLEGIDLGVCKLQFEGIKL